MMTAFVFFVLRLLMLITLKKKKQKKICMLPSQFVEQKPVCKRGKYNSKYNDLSILEVSIKHY